MSKLDNLVDFVASGATKTDIHAYCNMTLQVQAAAGRPPQKYPECNQGDLEHAYQVQSLVERLDNTQSWTQK